MGAAKVEIGFAGSSVTVRIICRTLVKGRLICSNGTDL